MASSATPNLIGVSMALVDRATGPGQPLPHLLWREDRAGAGARVPPGQIAAGPGGRSAPDASGGLQKPPRLRGRHGASRTAGALSMRGAAVTPFHFPRRQSPFITFPAGNSSSAFPGTRDAILSLFVAVDALSLQIREFPSIFPGGGPISARTAAAMAAHGVGCLVLVAEDVDGPGSDGPHPRDDQHPALQLGTMNGCGDNVYVRRNNPP